MVSLVTEDMRQRTIGLRSGPSTLEVDRGAVQRFAEAVGDPNPLWNDEASARKSRYGGMIAPPTFLRAIRLERPQLPFDIPFTRNLDGGGDWEYFEPGRVGDRITAEGRILDVWERAGRLGPMVLIATELTYTNQFEEVVATQVTTLIRY